MSTSHRGGNIQNEITLEEHDGTNYAKRVNVVAGTITSSSTVYVGTPTLYAVVNTSAAGQASVVLDNSISNIGFATVHVGTPTLYAVVNTGAVGVTNSIVTVANFPTSTQIVGNVTLSGPIPTGLNNIGFATVAVSTPTLYAVVNTGAAGVQNSMVTLNAGPNYIGLVSVSGKVQAIDVNGNLQDYPKENDNWNAADHGIILFARDVDTSPSKYRAVQTDANGHLKVVTDTLPAGVNSIGFVTVVQASSARSIGGNVTLDDGSLTGLVAGVNSIGFATVAVGSPIAAGVNSIGFATIRIATNENTYIGLVTANIGNTALVQGAGAAGAALVGNPVRIAGSDGTNARSILTDTSGRTVLGAGTFFVGLVTAHVAFGSEATVYSGVISATGNTTLFVAPASNRFFIKDIIVSSLGRSEIEFKSGATTLLPFTALSTTAGYGLYFGEVGKPARAATDALVANLNGAATVSIGVTYRIAP